MNKLYMEYIIYPICIPKKTSERNNAHSFLQDVLREEGCSIALFDATFDSILGVKNSCSHANMSCVLTGLLSLVFPLFVFFFS